MIGRLDRYVLKTALGSYIAGLVFIMGMFILLHLLTRIGEYTSKAADAGTGTGELLWLIIQHYAYFVPIVFVMVAPFVSVIAGMFAVARLMSDNEIAPMIFTGRSTVRCLAPILVLAALSGGAMVAAWEFVVPKCSEPLTITKGILRGKVDHKDPRLLLSNLLVKQRSDAVRIDLNIANYDHVGQRATGLKMLDESDGAEGAVVLDADAAVWVPAQNDWALEEGWRTSSAAGGARSRQQWLGLEGVTPELLFRIGKEDRETVELGYSELRDLLELRPSRVDFTIAFHAHLTDPLANIILLILALPFAVSFERGSKIWRVVYAIAICGGYLVFNLTCQNLGRSMIDPVVATWTPPIVFGSFGVAFLGALRT